MTHPNGAAEKGFMGAPASRGGPLEAPPTAPKGGLVRSPLGEPPQDARPQRSGEGARPDLLSGRCAPYPTSSGSAAGRLSSLVLREQGQPAGSQSGPQRFPVWCWAATAGSSPGRRSSPSPPVHHGGRLWQVETTFVRIDHSPVPFQTGVCGNPSRQIFSWKRAEARYKRRRQQS